MIRWRPYRARRHIAVDLGSKCIKLLLVESSPRGWRVLGHQLIDLHEEGLLEGEDVSRHLEGVFRSLGEHPLALAIAQHLAIAQVIDLPSVAEPEIRRVIEDETVNLSGLGESPALYDYCHLQPYGRFRNPCWVAISREENVQKQIARVGAETENIQSITTTANALISAYRSLPHGEAPTVLVDLGAATTSIALICGAQGVLAASLPQGSDAFTQAIATLKKCPLDEAESLKRTQDLLQGEGALTGMPALVDQWWGEVQKVLQDWFATNADVPVTLAACEVRLSGGGALQPGLLDYLRRATRLSVGEWPRPAAGPADLDMVRFGVACGAAL